LARAPRGPDAFPSFRSSGNNDMTTGDGLAEGESRNQFT
jgi:hypothetical protein